MYCIHRGAASALMSERSALGARGGWYGACFVGATRSFTLRTVWLGWSSVSCIYTTSRWHLGLPESPPVFLSPPSPPLLPLSPPLPFSLLPLPLSLPLLPLPPPFTVLAQREGDLRLAGYGASRLAGRLEIFLNGEWGTVCSPRDTLDVTKVACRQLGLGHFVGHVPGSSSLR